MKKILSYPLTALYYLFFFINLLVFHPIQWLCLKLGGYQAHKKSVDIFNFFLMRCLNVLGTRFSFDNPYDIPIEKPCIFISNHQGMYDIPPIIWYLRKHHPKFVSKKELGKGIPSISFNLRHGGSVLIDRKNKRESLIKMSKFAKYLTKTNRSAVIFPEGTRSRTGAPKKFAVSGMQMLFKQMPEALIVPITINNSWELFKHGNFPMEPGVHIKLKVHEPIPVASDDPESLVAKVERTIIADIK
ncbi:1-acyl-sn-glycerol-3-phosphate acyltransferase [Salegentibacter sp. BLCTC]|uniref:1-acyl-sn-glycerol-3-phosphate acyltransferase n=1 Tax=Salegentibacter maritimus TaxID=2794347 RepID=A0ABS0TIV1_9FLAO|nr:MULTISPECIES: lysophospholipid acyltransferase family protein [Salegentibacter]MBE7641424.1 1-acyl-sn-glycerol-3-phosphate acyltransferase [Salegentibacter sp. BLCTC]MBI6120994.1 1-acyl-sn-glycerol-3-phosphate acyltransferase [Salegentibacter maritimus]